MKEEKQASVPRRAGVPSRGGPVVRARGGFREDLGAYFRSKMESNYARYLNFLQSKGKILKWEYEPKGVEYWFPGIKRGTRSYKPDFVVTRRDETTYIVEVKGYMDSVSRTKLKRMAKYYPEVEIIVVGNREYRAISRWARVILGWE